MSKRAELAQTALMRFLTERAKPVILTVYRQRQVIEVEGDPAVYGFRNGDFSAVLELVRNLLVGGDASRPSVWPLVDIGNRRHTGILWVPDTPNDFIIITDAELCGEELSERQQAANELALVNIEKSKTIRELKLVRDELQAKTTALTETHRFQRRLVDTLSHDLRTPLTSISGYAALLEPHLAENPVTMRALNAIQRNATYLKTLAENLLHLAAADNNNAPLQSHPFALDQLADDIESIMRPMADSKRLRLSVDWQSTAQKMPVFDDLRLRQILLNLVSNAVRYTREGRVDVELMYDGEQLIARVTDTGIGIAPEFHDSIFEPLNRGAQQGCEGAGLGLSIVRQLVEKMGGKITFQSAVGIGTRFQVLVPEQTPSENVPPVTDRAEPPLRIRSERVVIVDDDPDVAEMLVWSLHEVGFVPRLMHDPDAVYQHVAEQPPGLMIIDVDLGMRSGLAVTQELRLRGYTGSIIVFSGANNTNTRQAAKAAGADAFLAKPLDMPKFLSWMKRLLPSSD